MRVRERLVLGALMIGAMACGDSLAPPASEGRDLEFVLPVAKGELSGAVRYRTWDEPVSEREIAKARGVQQASMGDEIPTGGDDGGGGTGGGGGGGEAYLPWIISVFATGSFQGNQVKIEYGLFGLGTGHTMTPAIRVLSESGEVLLNVIGTGRTEDAPSYYYMRPTVEELFLIPAWCGATGELKVKFEVRVSLPMLSAHSIGKAQAGKDQIFSQRPCELLPDEPIGGGSGGSGQAPSTNGNGLYICYFDYWVDVNGIIYDAVLIGCNRMSGSILTV